MKRTKNVVGKCIICGKFTEDAETYSDDDPTGVERVCVCATCFADAALGRAVRNFKDWQGIRKSGPYFVCQDDSGDYAEWDTPEEALKDAGLMEVEK